MIEKDREDQGHYEEQDQHVAVIGPDNQQEKEAHHEDHEFRRDHVREYRADEKPFFTFEKRQTMRAMMPDMKRMGGDCRLPTGRTTQFQTTPQNPLDMFQIYFQSVGHILTRRLDIYQSPSLDTCLLFLPKAKITNKMETCVLCHGIRSHYQYRQ